MTNFPITPPPELVREWVSKYAGHRPELPEQVYVATCAAQWGADKELDACCEWLKAKHWIEPEFGDALRAARRPKPPSLAEEALAVLENEPEADDMKELVVFDVDQVDIVRRALERLQELEGGNDCY